MEKGKEHLDRAIKGLKQYRAPDVWNTIMDEIHEKNRGVLKSAIDGLAVKESPDIWSGLSQEISGKSSHEKTSIRRVWAIAASVSLALISLYFFISEDRSYTESIAYSTEVHTKLELNISKLEFEDDQELLDYVESHCVVMEKKCKNPILLNLIRTYENLNTEQAFLEDQLMSGISSKKVIQYLIQIEKDKVEVGKEMINFIKYS